MTRATLLKVLSLLLATTFPVAVCLPWFNLPVLGWSVPAPAWSRAGVACFVLAACLLLRTIGGGKFRWAVRFALGPAAYFWWTSAEAVKVWGAQNLGPAQLKLSTVNAALSTMGSETISLYEAPLWRSLEPQIGWQVAGAALLATLLTTAADGPFRVTCPSCDQKVSEKDRFCCGCGNSLSKQMSCSNCGAEQQNTDKFCRSCGHGSEES